MVKHNEHGWGPSLVGVPGPLGPPLNTALAVFQWLVFGYVPTPFFAGNISLGTGTGTVSIL